MHEEPVRILLIGMMGAGKSTVGRLLAEATGWPFLDNDALVRRRTGREPAVIDAEDGEEALHAAEIEAFGTAVEGRGPSIIAVAAAVVDDDAAFGRLAAAGPVVWLRGRPETLHERIGSGAARRVDARDLDWLRARSAARESRYSGVATLVVDVDTADPVTIAATILATLGLGPTPG